MRLRYVGPDEARDVALPGGFVRCPRMEWVDLVAEAEAAHIPADHALVVARSLISEPDWQSESHVKAARTRKTTDPSETDKEQDR